MEIIATPAVRDLVRREGGSLYVWTDPHRCCSGAMTSLVTSMTPAVGRRFEHHVARGFDLWFDPGARTPPDELHLDVKGWRNKRVEAYWNGCVFAV